MIRVLVSCAVVWLAFGCKDRQEPGEASSAMEAPPPTGDEAPVEPGELEVGQQPDEELEATQGPDEERGIAPLPDEKLAEPPRDLAAELQAAVGSPVDCLQDYQPSAGSVIRVSISAIVRPSGLVIEPSATGLGLSANDRRCIQQRVGDVVLAPFDGLASQSVSTYVDLDYQRPAVEEYDVGQPTPQLKDVVQPLPKKETVRPSGVPIDKPTSDPIDGPRGIRIEGPKGVPVEGPKPKPIDGYEVEEEAERWTD
jgi:hypothetical protein